jgi:hypothetical protein
MGHGTEKQEQTLGKREHGAEKLSIGPLHNEGYLDKMHPPTPSILPVQEEI